VRQIAEAALVVIAESGLRRFTTKAIAEKVGIADGTIFHHFNNMEEIVLAAMDQLEDKMFAGGFPADPDPLRRLELFFRARAALLAGEAPMGRLMFSEQLVHAAGEAGREKLNSWRERNMAFVATCLQDLEAAGRLGPGLRASQLGVLVQGVLLTFPFERMVGGEESPDLPKRIADAWETLARLLIIGRKSLCWAELGGYAQPTLPGRQHGSDRHCNTAQRSTA